MHTMHVWSFFFPFTWVHVSFFSPYTRVGSCSHSSSLFFFLSVLLFYSIWWLVIADFIYFDDSFIHYAFILYIKYLLACN
jgi:hypothetical protein